MNYRSPELRNKLAAEYVLGTLQGGARRRFECLLLDDLELRALVEIWTQRIIPVGLELEDPGPSSRVWFELQQRLDVAKPTVRDKPSILRWLQSLFPSGIWGAFSTGVVGGIAIGLAGMLLIAPGLRMEDSDLRSSDGKGISQPRTSTEGQLPDSYIAPLLGNVGAPALLVTALRFGTLLRIQVLQGFTIDAEEVPVLWALPKGEGPRLLGPLPTEGAVELDLPAVSEQAFASVGELAVSIELRAARPFSVPQRGFVMRGPLIKTW